MEDKWLSEAGKVAKISENLHTEISDNLHKYCLQKKKLSAKCQKPKWKRS